MRWEATFMALCQVAHILHMSIAESDCACLQKENHPLKDRIDGSTGCIATEILGNKFCFPKDYGIGGCAAHDLGVGPFCKSNLFTGALPEWCHRKWCFVDPKKCMSGIESKFFPGTMIRYTGCGEKNMYKFLLEDSEHATVGDLGSSVESHVINTKFVLEDWVLRNGPALQAKKENITTTLSDSCDCKYCFFDSCWNDERSTDKAVVVRSPFSGDTPYERTRFSCLADYLDITYSLTGTVEIDNINSRRGFQYFGDHATGSTVLYPGLELCSEKHDARAQPWYVVSVSGPKNIVLVVEAVPVSSPFYETLKAGAVTILQTLSAVDSFSMIIYGRDGSIFQFAPTVVNQTTKRIAIETLTAQLKLLSKDTETLADLIEPLFSALNLLEDSTNDCSHGVILLSWSGGYISDEGLNILTKKVEQVASPVIAYAWDNFESYSLQSIACATGGIFHAFSTEKDLVVEASRYYEFFASMLPHRSQVRWIKHISPFSGSETYTACAPLHDLTRNETTLLGVTCVELGVFVNSESLDTCRYGSGSFYGAIDLRARQCRSWASPEDANCLLNSFRKSKGFSCPGTMSSNGGTCSIIERWRNMTKIPAIEDPFSSSITLTGCSYQVILCPNMISTTILLAVVPSICCCCLGMLWASACRRKDKGGKNSQSYDDDESIDAKSSIPRVAYSEFPFCSTRLNETPHFDSSSSDISFAAHSLHNSPEVQNGNKPGAVRQTRGRSATTAVHYTVFLGPPSIADRRKSMSEVGGTPVLFSTFVAKRNGTNNDIVHGTIPVLLCPKSNPMEREQKCDIEIATSSDSTGESTETSSPERSDLNVEVVVNS